MAVLGKDTVTTDDWLSVTWGLLLTTEKEQLFIIDKSHLFGIQAGDVLQVIDVEKTVLNNIITDPPDGVFSVRSNIDIASPPKSEFRIYKCGSTWEKVRNSVSTFWARLVESVYLDDNL